MAGSKADVSTGGALVVKKLRSQGTRFVFGVPGGQTLAITDALLDSDGIRFVTTRHEGAAACMADAVGRLTGRPGVCLATTGPGATNLLTGIGGAYRDSSPVLVLTCNNNLRDLGRDDAQAADHVRIFGPLTKWATLVGDSAQIAQVLDEAYIQATTGCPGPVLVDFARNTLEEPLKSQSTVPAPARSAAAVPAQRPLGDAERVRAAADLLSSAASPVMWVGNGLQLSGATDAALRLAELLSMPVITTFNALGSLPTDHPLVFGPRSRMGTQLSSQVLADADLLLVVGNSLNAISTSRWSIDLPESIVQIDIESSTIGRYYSARTLGIHGDARSVLEQLALKIAAGHPGGEAAAARQARIAGLQEAKRQWWSQAEQSQQDGAGVIAPDVLVHAVRAASPDDTILVVDAGNPGVWTHLWQVRKPGTYLKPVGFGNMGFALPAAIAAKLIYPQTPVVALIGDGSLGMTMGELETVAREGVDPCIVIMNDAGYGNIRQEELVKYGRTVGVDFQPVDYAAVARACGLEGVRVTSAEGLEAAVRDALGSGRPWLIDAQLDATVNAWTFPLFRPYDPGE